MKIIIYSSALLICLLAFALWVFLVLITTTLVRGRFSGLKGRPLTNGDIAAIMNNGIIHFTRPEAAKQIIKKGYIKPSDWFLSYSNNAKPCSFFFIYDYFTSQAHNRNLSSNKNTGIHIRNIDRSELHNFQIRLSDNAVFYISGAFSIKSLNCKIINIEDIPLMAVDTNSNYCKYYSTCCAIASLLLGSIVVTILPLILISILN